MFMCLTFWGALGVLTQTEPLTPVGYISMRIGVLDLCSRTTSGAKARFGQKVPITRFTSYAKGLR